MSAQRVVRALGHASLVWLGVAVGVIFEHQRMYGTDYWQREAVRVHTTRVRGDDGACELLRVLLACFVLLTLVVIAAAYITAPHPK